MTRLNEAAYAIVRKHAKKGSMIAKMKISEVLEELLPAMLEFRNMHVDVASENVVTMLSDEFDKYEEVRSKAMKWVKVRGFTNAEIVTNAVQAAARINDIRNINSALHNTDRVEWVDKLKKLLDFYKGRSEYACGVIASALEMYHEG